MIECGEDRNRLRYVWFAVLTFLQPSLEGSLAFARGISEEDVFYAEVFVKFRPVDAFALADEAPIVSLFAAGVQQPWIPRKGNRNCSPIFQVNYQSVVRDEDVCRDS